MKTKILQAAVDNIQIYGLKKFTMDSICHQLRISKKTIYKYFDSKDSIIEDYFNQTVESDMASVNKVLDENISLQEKFKSVIYSYHTYKIPLAIIQEAKIYYPSEWEKINKLKNFKIEALLTLLKEAKSNGLIKDHINLDIISLMIDKVADELLNGDILEKNNLKLSYATDQILQIILNGILK